MLELLKFVPKSHVAMLFVNHFVVKCATSWHHGSTEMIKMQTTALD